MFFLLRKRRYLLHFDIHTPTDFWQIFGFSEFQKSFVRTKLDISGFVYQCTCTRILRFFLIMAVRKVFSYFCNKIQKIFLISFLYQCITILDKQVIAVSLWTISTRGYNPFISQCFDTETIYKRYYNLLLKFRVPK